MITVGIDPGKHHAGWAIFVEGTCVRAGVAKAKPQRDTHGPEYRQHRIREVQSRSAAIIAEQISAHVEIARRLIVNTTSMRIDSVPVEFVSEVPQGYTDDAGRVQGAPMEDLVFLALTAGTIAGEIRQPKRVRYVEPNPWKGNRSDKATWEWIRKKAKPEEIPILIACGVWDADSGGKNFHHGLEGYGVGLWSLYRL